MRSGGCGDGSICFWLLVVDPLKFTDETERSLRGGMFCAGWLAEWGEVSREVEAVALRLLRIICWSGALPRV